MLSASELQDVPTALLWLAWAAYALGGLVCVANFKLFVDWLLYRARKEPKEVWKHISPLPIVGSLIVFMMLRTLGSIPAVMAIGLVLIAIDTGGIPWIIAGISYQGFLALRKRLGRLFAIRRD